MPSAADLVAADAAALVAGTVLVAAGLLAAVLVLLAVGVAGLLVAGVAGLLVAVGGRVAAGLGVACWAWSGRASAKQLPNAASRTKEKNGISQKARKWGVLKAKLQHRSWLVKCTKEGWGRYTKQQLPARTPSHKPSSRGCKRERIGCQKDKSISIESSPLMLTSPKCLLQRRITQQLALCECENQGLLLRSNRKH